MPSPEELQNLGVNLDLATKRKKREAHKRKKVWKSAKGLNVPENKKDPNYHYRFVRHEIHGESDTKNVVERMQEGYEVVQASELGDDLSETIDKDTKRIGGAIQQGDTILMKIPTEEKELRDEFYDEKTRKQLAAVDADLARGSHAEMRVSKRRKSVVTRGSPDFDTDDSDEAND